jgi:hypothetical protein
MLSRVAHSLTIRYVVGAARISPNTLLVLEMCDDRHIGDRAFSK